MIFKIIRAVLTPIVLSVDWLTRPNKPEHSADLQAALDENTKDLALYQFRACPFCIKTCRAIRRLGLNIEIRDAQHNEKNRVTLLSEGGSIQVPCLAITENGKTTWLYESDAIIEYLQQLAAQTTEQISKAQAA